MRVLLLVAVLGLLVALPASASAKDCGQLDDTVGEVSAKGIGCHKALEIVAAHDGGTKKPAGFRFRVKRYEGGATWTGKKGAKRIRYSRAD